MKKNTFLKLLFILSLLLHNVAFAQQATTFAFGPNLTNFADWQKKPVNFFNPEIFLITEFSKYKNLLFTFDVFYGEFPQNQKAQVGSVISRLNFSLKANYLITSKKSAFGIGPTLRNRNDKTILALFPPINPTQGLIDTESSIYDLGLNGSFLQTIRLRKKSNLIIKLNYTIFNKGANPLSCGFFYGLKKST